MRRLLTGAVLTFWAAAALAAPLTLRGTVLDPNGTPVAGALVRARDRLDEEHSLYPTSVTDQAGRFSLTFAGVDDPEWPRPLLATKDGYGAVLVAARAQPPQAIVLRLQPLPPAREGFVLCDGKPVAGAEATVTALRDAETERILMWSESGPLLSAKSDANGRFSLPGLDATLDPDVEVTGPGLTRQVWVETALGDVVEVKLDPEATIRGRITAQGHGVAGAEVEFRGGWLHSETTTTDANGEYCLRHLWGDKGMLIARAPAGFVRWTYRTLTLERAAHLTAQDFEFARGACVSGTVTDAAGEPVFRGWVGGRATGGKYGNCGGSTDRQGHYEVWVEPGQVKLEASPPYSEDQAARMYGTGATLTLREGERVTQDFRLPAPRRARFRVLLPDGAPAPGAQIVYSLGTGKDSDTAGADGSFELTLLPEPRLDCRILARVPERDLYAVRLLGELLKDPVLRLQQGTSASVRVRDTRSQPLAAVHIGAWAAAAPGALSIDVPSAVTDAAGNAVFRSLPAGQRTRFIPQWSIAHLVAPGPWQTTVPGSAELTCELALGEARALPEIVVDSEGRSLDVFVGDEQGNPVAGAQVWTDHDEKPFTTDARGRVVLRRLAVMGPVTLLALHPGAALAAVESLEPQGQYCPLLLRRPGTATGVLMAEQGRPPAGWKLVCQRQHPRTWRGEPERRLGLKTSESTAVTDADGRWRLEGLLPGAEYELFGRRDERGLSSFHLRFRAAGGPEPQQLGVARCDSH